MMPCEVLSGSLGTLFECEERGDYIRVRTPFLYPDGDLVDLYWRPHGELGRHEPVGILSDFGETLRWLRMQTATTRRSPNQDRIISDVCLTHGVERMAGELLVRVGETCSMCDAVTKLSQAAMRVADIVFTFRAGSVCSVADEVADFLTDRGVRYGRGDRQVGRSGKVWTPDFHTITEGRSAFVYLLVTGSRSRAQACVEHVFTAWHDLSHHPATTPQLGFISLFDDTVDVWSDEHYRLLEETSDIAYWSRPDELARIL